MEDKNKGIRSKNAFEELDSYKEHPNSVFADSPTGAIYESLKKIYVENGDKLSFQYTGTDSNISRVTKQGGQGFMGKLEQWTIGVTRYYQCVMNDDFKHECI